jgi:cyclopropane-fatty-acyl-phospholipid synthase
MAIDTPVEVLDERPREAAPGTQAADAGVGDGATSRRSIRRVALAQAILAILQKAVGGASKLTLELDGGSASTPVPGSAARVRVHGPDAVARIVWPPTPDGLAEGYLRGDLEIDGDVGAAIEAAQTLDPRRLRATDLRQLVRFGLELHRDTPNAPPLQRIARLSGRRHSRARDLAAVRFHYDVGEDFYRLWLDRRLTYSCAYFEHPDDPPPDLDAAQEAKLDLICRKLDLRAGQRLLDIGCGWGSLILFAAERYGVDAVGVTLSEHQAAEANRGAADAGLESHARAEVRDYRDLGPLGTFDAIASVGMFEHVGAANLQGYFESARDALVPGGRFLNHGIATAEGRRDRLDPRRNSRFIERYVFPDGELVPIERAIAVARDAVGFELLDVQLLRPHYALTLRAWVDRLERAWDDAVAVAGEEVARTWRLYMSGARVGFEHGELDVAQILLAVPLGDATPAPRPLRPWW